MTTDRAALSVDFEFFEHTPAYRAARGTCERGVGREALDFLLDVLAANDARATFFVVGEIAETDPELVERVARAGHEVASHTHVHEQLSTLRAGERRREVVTSRERLRAVADAPVTGFRAPAFDVTDDLFGLLADAGYEYDSSVVPARSIPGWYGGEFERHRPCPARDVGSARPGSSVSPESDLREVPVSVMPGVRLPLSGAWPRLLGRTWTAVGMDLLARRGVAPVLYVHPWELVDLPDVAGVPRRVTVRTGNWMRRTLERLLAKPYEFVPVGEVGAEVGR